MRMMMAVVPKNQGEAVLDALVNAGYTATFSETRGGMLRQSQLSLFIAVKEEEVSVVLDILKAHCKSHTQVHHGNSPQRFDPNAQHAIAIGGGVVFIWTLEQFENL